MSKHDASDPYLPNGAAFAKLPGREPRAHFGVGNASQGVLQCRYFRLSTAQAALYNPHMKAILASIVAGSALCGLIGCESDVPPAQEAGNKLERGLTGQGTIYQPDRSNDPIIREQSRVGQ